MSEPAVPSAAKNTICLWFNKDAEEAARFYSSTFPNSSIQSIQRAPSDFPSGKKDDVITVNFTVAGVSCVGLNGGPAFKQTEAFSFMIATDDQAETDRYWDAIVNNGGKESECGWCKDKWSKVKHFSTRIQVQQVLISHAIELTWSWDCSLFLSAFFLPFVWFLHFIFLRGVSWQITPRTLTDALAKGGEESKRAFEVMMTMKKIDVAKIDAARRG